MNYLMELPDIKRPGELPVSLYNGWMILEGREPFPFIKIRVIESVVLLQLNLFKFMKKCITKGEKEITLKKYNFITPIRHVVSPIFSSKNSKFYLSSIILSFPHYNLDMLGGIIARPWRQVCPSQSPYPSCHPIPCHHLLLL